MASTTMIYEELKPGIRENDIVALFEQDALYEMARTTSSDQRHFRRNRCNPHPQQTSTTGLIRRRIRAFFDILQSYQGYRPAHYPARSTWAVRQPSQTECLYKGAAKWDRRPPIADEINRA